MTVYKFLEKNIKINKKLKFSLLVINKDTLTSIWWKWLNWTTLNNLRTKLNQPIINIKLNQIKKLRD